MSRLVHAVDVDRPVTQVFDAWSRLEDFPAFMGGVASVQVLDQRSSHWVTIGRERREFGAVITESVPATRIAWESRGLPAHHGVVEFQRLPGDRTRLTVVLEWEPNGLFDRLGDRLGLVRRQFERDIDAFGAHVTAAPSGPGGDLPAIDGRSADDPSPADGVVDTNRAMLDRARGHDADSPADIPARGWVEVTKRTFEQVKSDNVSIIAAGVAFYFFLALIPAFLAVVSVYGLVADPADIQRQLDKLLGALPRDAAAFVTSQLETIVTSNSASLSISLVVSVGFALFSASKGMQALVTALDVAYDEEETRKFVKLRALGLALTVAATLCAVVLVGGMALIGRATEELGDTGKVLLTILRWPVLGGLLMLFLAALYRYAPDRDKARWRWVTPGAALAVLLWLIGSFGFSFYVNNFGSYNETYGALAGIIVLLLWLFLSAYVIVLGAEFDAEAERQTARDSTTGPRRSLGIRGAHAADTVAGVAER